MHTVSFTSSLPSLPEFLSLPFLPSSLLHSYLAWLKSSPSQSDTVGVEIGHEKTLRFFALRFGVPVSSQGFCGNTVATFRDCLFV